MNINYDIYSLAIMTAIVSFLVFVLENIWLMFTKGYIDNRNMGTPFLLGYGILIIGFYLLIGGPQNITLTSKIMSSKLKKYIKYIIYFFLAMIIVSLCEILLGQFVEKIFGFEYWNYSLIPMHITKYTSIPTSAGFAFIITFFMGHCFYPLLQVVNKISMPAREFLGITLTFIMLADFFISFYKMYKNKALNTKWTIYTNKSKNKLNRSEI